MSDTPMEISTASLTATEAMLLAQLVHEHGNAAWPVVCQTLSSHPLLDKTSLADETTAQALYTELMKELEVDMSVYRLSGLTLLRCLAGRTVTLKERNLKPNNMLSWRGSTL